MPSDQLTAHLEFFAELGVDGVHRDSEWRRRTAPSRVRDSIAEAMAADAGSAREAVADTLPDASTDAHTAVPAAATDPAERSPSDDHDESGLVTAIQPAASPDEVLLALKLEIGPQCTRCKLHRLGRQQVVFGVGDPRARLMFVGEAPGADEDVQGEPFVGRAGQLLTKIIEAIGLRRSEVYIANVIKCRPPGNRNPEPDEVNTCEPFLFSQIDTIKPKVIVALGKFAAQSLLRTTEPITRIRGREFAYRDAILMPTYHPAYLLRNPSAKRDVWEDMKRVRAILTGDGE